jgi:predicted small integral membrane protein
MKKEAQKGEVHDPPQIDKSSVVYTIGILSIVFAVLSPIAGVILGIIGVFMGRKARNELMKRGKFLCIVGVILGIALFIVTISIAFWLKTAYPQFFQQPYLP